MIFTLEHIKTILRIKTSAFDGEISTLIEACKLDLSLAGLTVIDENDPLIIRAVALYAKVNFGFNKDSEMYQKSYDTLKRSLVLAGDYIV